MYLNYKIELLRTYNIFIFHIEYIEISSTTLLHSHTSFTNFRWHHLLSVRNILLLLIM